MPLEIKANNWYRTRGGEIAYVFGINPYARHNKECIVGVKKEGHSLCWFTDGKWMAFGSEDEMDLVEHLPDCDGFDWVPAPKIRLELDKKYVLANGDVVGPLFFDPRCHHDYKYTWDGMQWSVYGVRYIPALRETHNIVSEYIEPEPVYEPWDFESMPPFVKVRDKCLGDLYSAMPAARWVKFSDNTSIDYDLFFRGYEQLDGSPCGKRVQP